MTRRIGLYGGCFNPVHAGHLASARGALAALALDSVIFIPSGNPPLKGAKGLADGAHRLEMLKLAIADDSRFVVSSIEIDRTGPSFTVDTVRMLRCTFPYPVELFFLLGDDCLGRLPLWKGIDELHSMLRFAILPRIRDDAASDDARLIRLSMPPVEVSSTEIRNLLADGDTLSEEHLPPAVAQYIQHHHLYSAVSERAYG